VRGWRWLRVSREDVRWNAQWALFDGAGRERATITENEPGKRYTWHTWDDHGTGGVNAEAGSLNAAKDQAMAAIVRQGWAPGGWKVQW
jgi:hypothetical protein